MERILTAYSAVTAHPSSNRAVTRQVLILLLRIMGTMKKFIGPVSCSAILLALFLMMNVQNAMAVRPFVTDHARVVGYHVLQLESSVKADKNVVANLNLFAFDPTENLVLFPRLLPLMMPKVMSVMLSRVKERIPMPG